MALIKPDGSLVVRHPASNGIITTFGLSRDWRPSEDWANSGTEFIEPLQAIAPIGDFRPVDMAAPGWVVNPAYNPAVRAIIGSGNPECYWTEFYDGSAYAGATPLSTYASYLYTNAAWCPNWSLQLCRYTPPPTQEITPYVSVTMAAALKVSELDGNWYLDNEAGTWEDGYIALILPFASETWKRPILAAALSLDPYIHSTTNIMILSEGPESRSLDQGVSREGWSFEVTQDAARFSGGHILIRSTQFPGEWWHYYNDCVRVYEEVITCLVCGCKQQLNISPVYYSNAGATNVGYTWPQEFKTIPGADWEPDASWGLVETEAVGWTETVDSPLDTDLFNFYRPVVTFTPSVGSSPVRPILWFVTEDHEPTITVPGGLPAEEDTEGDGLLIGLSYEQDKTWQQARGEAQFRPAPYDVAPYPDWREGAPATISMGWDPASTPGADFELAVLCETFIPAEGIDRGRRGDELQGVPQLAVRLADYVEAILSRKAIKDMRQAGGQTVGDWWRSCGANLGLPPGLIYVDPAVEALVIPLGNPRPSIANLEARDGQSWAAHFWEVCSAIEEAGVSLRWGWDDYLFVDGGTPVYVPGSSVISLVIDYDTLTENDTLYEIQHTHSGTRFRNCLKASYGKQKVPYTWYWIDTEAARTDVGGDFWAVIDDPDAASAAAIAARFSRDCLRAEDAIRWTTAMRRAVAPDQFIQIGDCPEIGLEVGAVYQVSRHRMSFRSDEMDGESVVEALLVYSPGGYYH